MEGFNKLSIIIPVYNEERHVSSLLKKVEEVVLDHDIKKEVIIVNDCSTDNTVEVVNKYISSSEMNIQFFSHEKNNFYKPRRF